MTFDPAILFGTPTTRVDGVAKVTGAARYASDEPVANPAFACLVTSNIARGHITGFDLDAARAVPGVLDILTHETVGDRIKSPPGPDGGATTTTLESNRIWHDGQIIAVGSGLGPATGGGVGGGKRATRHRVVPALTAPS